MSVYRHSVSLESEKCKGCTHCLRRCPTEAIRIRDGHAVINTERCIDCGECIRLCPHKAKKAIYDPLESINNFKYKIALPPPTLYGQFDNLDDVDCMLKGLGEQLYCMRVNIVDSLISIILIFTLLPMYGIRGYVAVIFITELINTSFSILKLINITNIKSYLN